MTQVRTRAYLPFLLPGALLSAVVIGVPFVANIAISFTDWDGVSPVRWTGLDNYSKLLGDTDFWSAFEHNVGLLVAMALVPTALGLVLAFGIGEVISRRFGPRTASILRACIYLPQVLPMAVVGIVWSWILMSGTTGGALDSALTAIGLGGLGRDWLGDPNWALWSVMGVLVWFQLGYPLVIFMSGLQRVDPALYEAADLDGASWLRKLWHITVPQLRPEIAVVLLTCSIASLKVFAPIYVLTRGGPGGATNVPSYYSYVEYFEKLDVGYGSAISTVLVLLILALTVGFMRVQQRGEQA
ncbi:ABC transporter permease subunit [Nocardia sp. ET3-3]|uniref:ABC transporter permease subunit n=1 Tax=Nocardia terrae TaxID=2675851 RepID=A0A7K1UUR6_9NOCA|nr:sugar ABC transporter permease [Nocardia terrae]MVU78094.1 ABC transporter permease subunit [Nocardia terrae]